jgi:hypothetical protein
MNTLRKLNGYILSLTIIIILMFISNFINGEPSYLGEKLLSYVESLPNSYALIYSITTPINEENYNFFASNLDNQNCYVPNMEIFLYVRTPDKRIMEIYSQMYDITVTKNLLRSIKIGNSENNIYYIPLVNAAQIDENYIIFYQESTTILYFINPLAGTDYSSESKNFIKANYKTQGNEIRFPSMGEPIFVHAFLMPDNSSLCPPIEKIELSSDGKIIRKFSITSQEYALSNGIKIIFPKNMIMSWGDNDKYKSYYEVIYFDILQENINDDLFKLDIPDGAEVTDNRLKITYTKNSNSYNRTEVKYPTKFSYFGFSFEKVKELIDKKINEDRQKNAQYIK